MDLPFFTKVPEKFEPDRSLHHTEMSPFDQELADRLSVGDKKQDWTAKTAAAAWNLAVGMALLFILINGAQVLAIFKTWILAK